MNPIGLKFKKSSFCASILYGDFLGVNSSGSITTNKELNLKFYRNFDKKTVLTRAPLVIGYMEWHILKLQTTPS